MEILQTCPVWVWPAGHTGVNLYADFVHTFSVRPGACVSLYISADSQYAVWVNGRFAGCGQYPDFPDYKVYDCLDITSLVQPGDNRLCVQGYCQVEASSTYYPGRPGVLFRIEQDGQTVAASGPDTLCRPDREYRSGPVVKFSGQLSFSFGYDAAGDDGWRQREAAGFAPPEIRTSPQNLYPRPVERLQIFPPTAARVLRQGFFCADAADAELGRQIQQARWQTSPQGADGRCWRLDLGRETAGLLYLDIETPESAEVLVGFGEHLADGRVRAYMPPRHFAAAYRAVPGRRSFTHWFKRLGCRYLEVYIRSKAAVLHAAGLRPTLYPAVRRRPPAFPNPLAAEIYETGVRTLLLCMHEHYEDTPWREQALYAQDARLQMLSGFGCFEGHAFARASLRLLAQGMRSDGLLELCSPGVTGVTIPMFSLQFVTALSEYTEHSGDIAFFRELSGTALGLLRLFRSRRGENGLIGNFTEPPYWNFYEWAPGLDGGEIDRRTPLPMSWDLPLNAAYSAAAQATARSWRLVGEPREAEEWQREADQVNRAIHRVFYRGDERLYYTFADHAGLRVPSQLSAAMAVWCGACPREAYTGLLPLLRGEDPRAVPLTLSSQYYRYEALLQDPGQAQFVRRDVEARWGAMLRQGATSFWETEKGEADFGGAGSLCHGWSAIPVYLYHRYEALLNAEENKE